MSNFNSMFMGGYNSYIMFCLLLLSFNLFSCQNTDVNIILDKINLISKSLNINTESTKLESSDKSIALRILFKEPYISNQYEQDLYLSYLVYKIKELRSFDEIRFEYAIDNEIMNNLFELVYDKEKQDILVSKYDEGNLLQAIEYCLKEFEESDVYLLDNLVKWLRQNIAIDLTLDKPFYDILFLFNIEKLEGKATRTFALLYMIAKEKAKTQKEYRKLPNMINTLWEIIRENNDLEVYLNELNQN